MPQDILSRNNVTVFGRGTQPLVFAHGFGCDQNMWRFVAPAFAHQYRIVLFDYVGSGNSDLGSYRPERYDTLDGYVQDVLDVAGALALKDIVFVGHSVSAMVGLLASIREPGLFERLILLGPSPCYLNDPPDYVGGFERAELEGLLALMEKNDIGWAHFLAPTVMSNPQRPELAAELEKSFCSTDPRVAQQFAEVTFFSDSRADLPQVTVPSLIMQCSEDIIAPAAVGDYLQRHLPGSTLRRMEATGHCPHMSHPEETIRVIREYLASPTA